MLPADDLPAEWRGKAKDLRSLALESIALAYEDCADTLELELRVWSEEPLTLQEAAEASGYSADHLGRLVREGKIPNVGRLGAPRVKRRDLPSKPKVLATPRPGCDVFNAQIVQSIINGDR